MAVIDLTLDARGRDGAESDSTEITYTAVYTVETDNDLEDATEIWVSEFKNALGQGIPKINDGYVSPTGKIGPDQTFCVNRKAIPTPNKRIWSLIINYSNRIERPDLNIKNPLSRPPEIEWGSIVSAYPTTVDRAGNAIVNSAGDPFDPPLTDEDSWKVLIVSLYRVNFDPLFYGPFEGKVNSLKWNKFKKRQVKCRRIEAKKVFEGGFYSHRIKFEFEIRFSRIPTINLLNGVVITTEPDDLSYAWVNWVLDRGFREKDPNDPTTIRAIRDPFYPVPIQGTPALLDGIGHRLEFTDDPVYLGFEPLREIDFTALNLNNLELDVNKGI